MSRERRAREGGEGGGAAGLVGGARRRDMIVLYRVGTIPTESEDNDVRVRSRACLHPYGVEFASTLGHLSRLSHISAPRDIPETPSNLPLSGLDLVVDTSKLEQRFAARFDSRLFEFCVRGCREARRARGCISSPFQVSRERFPFGIAFDARFDRCASSSPRRTADPPNKKRARLMLMPRAKRLSRDCQERALVTRISSSIHSLGWTSSGSETVAWPARITPVISHQSRASSTGQWFGGNRPKRAVLFSSRRVASSFARPPSNRRLNPSRPRARARASPLPPPSRTASNAQK